MDSNRNPKTLNEKHSYNNCLLAQITTVQLAWTRTSDLLKLNQPQEWSFFITGSSHMRHRQRSGSAKTSRTEGRIRSGASHLYSCRREELSAIRRWQKFIMACWKHNYKYNYNVHLKIVDIISYLPPKLMLVVTMSEIICDRIMHVPITRISKRSTYTDDKHNHKNLKTSIGLLYFFLLVKWRKL